jgi:hypothetical protein
MTSLVSKQEPVRSKALVALYEQRLWIRKATKGQVKKVLAMLAATMTIQRCLDPLLSGVRYG